MPKLNGGFPVVKNASSNAGDVRQTGSNPGSRSSLGGEPGNPLQYSCLENPMDRESWQATQSIELDTTEATEAHMHETVWQERWLPGAADSSTTSVRGQRDLSIVSSS